MMKRINSKKLWLPRMAGDDEVDVRSYDYARRTVNPTLDDYVIGPFTGALKDAALNAASKEVGVDEDNVVVDEFNWSKELGDMHFNVRVYPSTRTSFEDVLTDFEVILGKIVADNLESVRKDGVRKVNGETYVLVEHLFDELARLKIDHTSDPFNQRELSVLTADGNKFPLDETVDSLVVYFDPKRCAVMSPKNAAEYQAARSLKKRVDAFKAGFKKGLYAEFNPERDEKMEVNFELSDGSGVRYLFSVAESAQYGKVFDGLVGMKTKKIAASTGDLVIVRELAFEDYKNRNLCVSTERDAGVNLMTVTRTKKDNPDDVRSFGVYHDGKLYVRTSDVIESLKVLRAEKATTEDRLKVDFFAAPPAYLD